MALGKDQAFTTPRVSRTCAVCRQKWSGRSCRGKVARFSPWRVNPTLAAHRHLLESHLGPFPIEMAVVNIVASGMTIDKRLHTLTEELDEAVLKILGCLGLRVSVLNESSYKRMLCRGT